MRDSACRLIIVEDTKISEVMLNIVEFSYVKEIVES